MPPIELHWSLQAGYPVIASLLGLPLLTALWMLTFGHARRLAGPALAAALLQLGLALDLYRRFDPELPGRQFSEWRDLPGPLDYHVGVAAPGQLLIPGIALVGLLLVLLGLRPGHRWNGPGFAALFAIQAVLVFLIAGPAFV
jgi:NADH-quinone oxidoreductase subunit M